MAKAKKYFIRTADGQKGPYTFTQMKASQKAGTFSRQAEYRTDEDEEWRPIKRLADRIAKGEAEKRTARAEDEGASEEREPPAPQQRPPSKASGILVMVLMIPLAVGYLWWSRMNRMEALGKGCLVPADCPSGMSCLLSMDEDRNIQAQGYCTFKCDDSSDCHSNMSCGEAIQTDSQGAQWDGMIRKSTRMCLKH